MAGPYGPGQTGAVQELELYTAGGTLTLPLYRAGDATRRQRDVSISGTYESGDSRATRNVVRRIHSFDMGAGYSRRPTGMDESRDWSAVADADNACYRFGYVVPGGEQTSVTVTAAWGPCRRIIPFNGDLWFVFATRIAYIADGLGTTLTDYYAAPDDDEFTDAEYWDGNLRVAQLCGHTGNDIHFFVTVAPSGASYAAALNPTPTAPAGTAATTTTPQLRQMVTVFWSYQGTSALRFAGQVGDYVYRYMTVPSGDPYDQANWSAEINVGESTFEIRRMVSSHDTMWVIKQDGVYAVTDANAAAGGENITPYWKDQLDADATASVAYYWQDKLFVGRNTTIEAIDVNSWQVQNAPRPVHVSYGRPNDGRINGRYSGLGSESGWLVGVLTNPHGASVVYGTPRRRESATAGVTEMDWFGPEVGPLGGIEITQVQAHTPESTLRPYLWLGGFANANGDPYVLRVDLFRGSSPLADTGHRYHSTASVTFTDEHWAARSATKGALHGTLAVRNCGAGLRVDLYLAIGAGAAFGGNPDVEVGTDVETQTWSVPTKRGSVVRAKVNLIGSAAVPPVLDELEMAADLGFPLRRRGTYLVELSDVRSGDDLPSGDDPDETLADLVALCESVEAFSMLCDDGETRTVTLDNVLPWRHDERSDSERKVPVVEIRYTEVAS